MRAGGEEAVCTVTVWKPGRSEGGDSAGRIGDSGKNRPVHGSWVQAADGSWYYLNPISDGSLGKMATGWRWISDASGREYCYYFHPNAGGPMGAMAASGKTPDGYEVDAQGRWCADGTPQTR